MIPSVSILMARLGEKTREETEKKVPVSVCSWPDELEGNCILSVEGTEVFVNKTYLSMYSPFFHRMFYGDYEERASGRYNVGGVDADAFIEMLRVILPTRKPIDENNVESLLVIADQFMMDHLRAECISFLCSDTEAAKSISCVILIVLAFRYGIDELKSRTLARLSTKRAYGIPCCAHRRCFTSLGNHPRCNELDEEARTWLFNHVSSTRPSTHKKILCNKRCRHFECACRKPRGVR
ncbi:hypothetical protein PMAYCL1PPCAC_07957 [Pristionchus mayeri]|uniref:BTB domain-containing protein n=1 Tax=Pristionchus mayeri TaxID=1317129 RepID=A0AAN4ZAU6_9BILA|nr:hypothetical protein PMAYCL1PPCAC_07957 [Pristionchus mayeri]